MLAAFGSQGWQNCSQLHNGLEFALYLWAMAYGHSSGLHTANLHKVFDKMHHQQGHANLYASAAFARMLQNIKQSKDTLQQWSSLCFSNPHASGRSVKLTGVQWLPDMYKRFSSGHCPAVQQGTSCDAGVRSTHTHCTRQPCTRQMCKVVQEVVLVVALYMCSSLCQYLCLRFWPFTKLCKIVHS